jgi:hypothetical protein
MFPRHLLSYCAVSVHANSLVAPTIGVPANSLQLSLTQSGRYVNLYMKRITVCRLTHVILELFEEFSEIVISKGQYFQVDNVSNSKFV